MRIPLKFQKIIDPFFQTNHCTRLGKVVGGSPYWIFTKNLTEDSIIYSAGAGGDISFELDLAKTFNSKILLFDPTPTGVGTAGGGIHKKIFFFKLAIADHSGSINLSLPVNPLEGSYQFNRTAGVSFPCTSILNFMKEKKHTHIDLLKMDIEGAEYSVLNNILKNKIPIYQIVLEFHHRSKEFSIFDTLFAIKRLYSAGYRLIYKNVDDYTFVKKELIKRFC